MRKRTPISLHKVSPVRSNKVKDYVSSVGSPYRRGELQLSLQGEDIWEQECDKCLQDSRYIAHILHLPTSPYRSWQLST